MYKFNPFTGKLDIINSYTLPTASDTVKGGVKIGLRLTMTDDVLSADVQAGGGDVLAPATHAASYIPQWNLTPNSKTLVEGLAVPAGGLAGITALNLKAPLTSPTFATSITGSYLTASEILITDASKNIVSAPVATYPSLAELVYLKGVTSLIQTQLNAKQGTLTNSAGLLAALSDETGTGLAVFNNAPTLIAPALGTVASGVISACTSTSMVMVTPVLGTPASGTLTNCTFPTLNQNTTGTAAGLSATLAIASGGTGATTLAAASIATYTGTETLTNKRINPRLVTAASYTTDTGTSLDVSTCDQFEITAQAGALLFNSPGGTPLGGQKLIIRIKDDATARALTWNAIFRAMGTALPSTTVLSKTLYLGLIYNATDTKWDLVASAQEA